MYYPVPEKTKEISDILTEIKSAIMFDPLGHPQYLNAWHKQPALTLAIDYEYLVECYSYDHQPTLVNEKFTYNGVHYLLKTDKLTDSVMLFEL